MIIMLSLLSACKPDSVLTVAFYNVENLFDTLDDPETVDEEFLPSAERMWNSERYTNKLNHLSKVISSLVEGHSPDVLGLCEVENRQVVDDLIHQASLMSKPYAIVHEESRDVRGIDVAAIYDSVKLHLVSHGTVQVNLVEFEEITRDILWMELEDRKTHESFYFIVNHWPSRRGGEAESEPKRMKAAEVLNQLVRKLQQEDSEAAIVICGDFNDEPTNRSIRETLGAEWKSDSTNAQLFNAMGPLKDEGKGSYCYRGDWNMLDQLIFSSGFQDGKGWDYLPKSATIHGPEWMRQHSDEYEGYPLRTFGGRTYLNGYSDHFPVYAVLYRPVR